MDTYAPFYAQLFGVGLLWVTVHCSGMCGPIIAGLTTSTQDPTLTGRARLWRAARGVFAYQGGRAVTYVLLGATAGLAGAAIEAWVRGMTRIAGLLVAIALLGAGIWRLPPVGRLVARYRAARAADSGDTHSGAASGNTTAYASIVRRLMRLLHTVAPSGHVARMASFGLVLGLLPCMLMFWVLGIAASTASPLHGALLMLGLVAMTTPVLLAAGCSTTLGRGGRLRKLGTWAVPAGIILSGVWLGLISMAANGWIGHVHIPFEFRGEGLVIMLW